MCGIFLKNKVKNYNSFHFHGKFFDRSQGSEQLCILLAGYKPFLYDSVFDRLERYIPENIDVCVCSSGIYSEELNDLCLKNNWSYLSTKENQIALIQNIAIQKHSHAKKIFKIDEDIFLTEGYFKKMIDAYHHAVGGDYIPGVIAPLILINGYSSPRIIDKLGVRDEFEKRFGKLLYATGSQNVVECNSDFAKFMWGDGGIIPSIDVLNESFGKNEICESPCSYRFSIGAILFTRDIWESMGWFYVNRNGNGLGDDEEQLGQYCYLQSRPIMVSENIVVGHLSFGAQNRSMQEYYCENKNRF